MSSRSLQRDGMPASDLLEEAVRLLRGAPASAWLAYFVGSIPGMLGALYFFADMSRSANAAGRLFESSVAMSLVYLWMKCWQSVFTARLRAEVLLQDPPVWTPGRVATLALAQIALQPIGLILRPAALVLTLPYVWTATFFQNITVLGDGSHGGLRELCRQAYAQCRLWPKRAHVTTTLLSLFGLFVWLNVVVAMISVPALMKMFFGIETMFSKHIAGMLNPTFFAASFAATYLCLDPIRKAVNVLRCFYGSSLRSGADLEVQLKRVHRSAQRTAAVAASVMLFLSMMGAAPVHAAMKQEPKVNSSELNRSLDDVLDRREYAWRAPRERKALPEAEESWFGKVKKDITTWMDKMMWRIGRMMGKAIKKISDWFIGEKSTTADKGGLFSLLGSVRFLFWVLLFVAAILLIVLITRARRRLPITAAEAEPALPQVDLNEENVTADQLPEDGWLRLARELMQSGELRLALRASYLAGLAHLGQRELIRLAKYKSNRDYDRELRRRARANPELLSAFDTNLDAFERAWYGEHAVTQEALGDFSANLEKIRAC